MQVSANLIEVRERWEFGLDSEPRDRHLVGIALEFRGSRADDYTTTSHSDNTKLLSRPLSSEACPRGVAMSNKFK